MRNLFSRITTISFLSSITLPSHTTGIVCYQCGTGAIFTDGPVHSRRMEAAVLLESCESFEQAFTWSVFAITCKESQVCTRSTTSGPDGLRNVRGCSERNNSLGQLHTLGCGTMVSARVGRSDSEYAFSDLICLCDTNYCNSAGANSSTFVAYFLVVLSITVKHII